MQFFLGYYTTLTQARPTNDDDDDKEEDDDDNDDDDDKEEDDCRSSPFLISECVGANLSNRDVSY